MSDYYSRNNRNSRRKRRGGRERFGFYTAAFICLAAVGMAVFSTYKTISSPPAATKIEITTQEAQAVNEYVQGVTDTIPVPRLDPTYAPEQPDTIPTEAHASTSPTATGDSEALRTMLSTDLSLSYPLKNPSVLRPFSKDSTYFKTLNVWRPHTGVDFAGDLGDDVFAMCDGTVTKIHEDKLYGKIIELSHNEAVCVYSGLGSVDVKAGQTLKSGDKIGTVGAVPFEASDENHIHVSVKINEAYADPMSFIDNEE